MNFAQVGNLLNITRDGARKRILKNQDQLLPYLEKDETGKIIGLKEDGIEPLRNLKGDIRKSFKDERRELEIKLLKRDIEHYQELYNQEVRHNDQLTKQLEDTNVRIQKLEAELDYYHNAGVMQRLLGYKKK